MSKEKPFHCDEHGDTYEACSHWNEPGALDEPIRKLPDVEPRIETGPVQFGKDWPGTFIRGDNAAYYAMCLEMLLNGTAGSFEQGALKGLLSDLKASKI